MTNQTVDEIIDEVLATTRPGDTITTSRDRWEFLKSQSTPVVVVGVQSRHHNAEVGWLCGRRVVLDTTPNGTGEQ